MSKYIKKFNEKLTNYANRELGTLGISSVKRNQIYSQLTKGFAVKMQMNIIKLMADYFELECVDCELDSTVEVYVIRIGKKLYHLNEPRIGNQEIEVYS